MVPFSLKPQGTNTAFNKVAFDARRRFLLSTCLK